MSDNSNKETFEQATKTPSKPPMFTEEEKLRIQADARKGSGFGTDSMGKHLPPFNR